MKIFRVKLILQLLMTLKRISKNVTYVSFAEPPKFGLRFFLLRGGRALQTALFNAISALGSVKRARAFLVTDFLIILRNACPSHKILVILDGPS